MRRANIGTFTRGLASAFLAGDWTRDGLTARAAHVLALALTRPENAWLHTLVREVREAFPRPSQQRRDALGDWLRHNETFLDAWSEPTTPHALRTWLLDRPRMGRAHWPVRPLDDEVGVAGWLGLTHEDLAWFADRRGYARRENAPKLRHYDYSWRRKADGSLRLLEAPRPRLKSLQRRVLEEILVHIPPHEAAHGFVRDRSVRTHAALHVGRPLVLKLDLQAFFANVSTPRLLGVFLQAGYPENVARTLLAICTHRTPLAILRDAPALAEPGALRALWRLRSRLSDWHLPQGAPTSPALANLAAFTLDLRLHALARSHDATYSRYADDLTFSASSSLRPRASRFLDAVSEIAREEGFGLNAHKTRVMPRSRRQSVTGIVVNARPNLARDDYDRLKAVLHNCVRHGPRTQAPTEASLAHFRAQLQGRVAWAAHLNATRGARLRALFDRIEWPPQSPSP